MPSPASYQQVNVIKYLTRMADQPEEEKPTERVIKTQFPVVSI